MRIFMFHLMPWDRLPASYEGPAWVTCPNSHYDPVHVYGERWRDRIAGARLEVIEGCGHLPPLERPAEFADAIRRFLGQS